MKIVFFLAFIFALCSCGSFKETVHKERLHLSYDSSEIVVNAPMIPNIKIIENPELYLSVETKKTGDVIINLKGSRIFCVLTLINGIPIKGMFYKFEPDSNEIIAYIICSAFILVSIIGFTFVYNYYDSWNKQLRDEYKEENKRIINEFEQTELSFKKEIQRLEKENDYLQQQLQIRYK